MFGLEIRRLLINVVIQSWASQSAWFDLTDQNPIIFLLLGNVVIFLTNDLFDKLNIFNTKKLNVDILELLICW